MKNILFILYYIIYSCTPAFGAATTTITADSIRSSNRTKTWTPPSITDVLTGLTDVQTLTNKTLTSPTINTPLIDVDTFTEQGSTPSTPAAGKRKVYAKADGIYHLDSAGNERKVGSGSGGGDVSYITNGNADDANASIFVPYADAAATRPVDGTGGSPTVTTSVSATAPLIGTKSFLLTKGAANVQGQGWAIPFTVNPAYRAKVLTISVDYIVNSGIFVPGTSSADSDVIWYIYDVTNSQLIEPSSIKMLSSSSTISDKFQASFQTSATGSSYRLIAHVATTSAVAYELKVDNVTVSPSNYIFGTPVTDSAPFTSTLVNFGTPTQNLFWKRDGNEIVLSGAISIGATAPTGGLQITLPPGFNYDTNKVGINGAVNPVGTATAYRNSTGATYYGVVMTVVGSTNLLQINSDAAGTPWTATNPITFSQATQDIIYIHDVRIPIAGLSSSVQMSDQTDTRIVSMKASHAGSTQSLTALVTDIVFPTTVKDTHGAWTGSTYVVKVPGDYLLSAGVYATGAAVATVVYINTVLYGNIGYSPTGQLPFSLLQLPNLKTGDVISIRSATTVTLAADTNQNISIFRLSGPSAIAASELVKSTITHSAGQSILASTITKLQATIEKDTHGMWSVSNSEWTQVRSGTGKIYGTFHLDVGATTSTIDTYLYKNGSIYKRKKLTVNSVANPYPLDLNWAVEGVAGDKWDIRVEQNTGTTRSIVAATTYNQVTFELD